MSCRRVGGAVGVQFLQTDPIGYKDDFNLYAYVGNDPLNKTDPEGTEQVPLGDLGSPGNLKVYAYPGPKVTDNRAEHGPGHIHIKDGKVEVRVSTDTWRPLDKTDSKLMTRSMDKWVKNLTSSAKDYIKSAQADIFETGKITGGTNMKGAVATLRQADERAARKAEEARQNGRAAKVSEPVRTVTARARRAGDSH